MAVDGFLHVNRRRGGCFSVLAKYRFQGELAIKYGANNVVYTNENVFSKFAEFTNCELYKPLIGKKVAIGGFDKIFDCVASSNTLDTSLRFTKAGGNLVIVGLASVPKKVDWTPIWFRELNIHGTLGYTIARYDNKLVNTFEESLKMINI